nr:hypothetical protein [Ornithinimicrobium flavum]
MAAGPDLDEGEDPLDDLLGEVEAGAGEGLGEVGRSPLVQLVHLAQDGGLGVRVGDAQVIVETPEQLAVVDLDGEGADGQVGEDAVDDRRRLGVVPHGELVLADDVHVALVELAEPAPLRALAAVDALHLVAAEGEGELVLVLGHVARQGDGEVEPEGELGERPSSPAACPSRVFSRAPVDCTK